MAETAVNLLTENLKQVINRSKDSNLEGADQLESLYKELGLLRTCLEDWEEKLDQHEELRTLERRIIDLAHEAEIAIGMFEEIRISFDQSSNLDRVRQEIEAVKTEVKKIYDKKIHDMGEIQVASSSKRDSATREEEIMVGFENEATNLKERLTGGPKRLEIISIVGMAGLGKTTLATKVYNDPLVVYHFHIRVWVSVSQEYRKKDLLLRLVSSVIKDNPNEIDPKSESELALLLYKHLKGRVYLIALDDIWDIRAWDDLKGCFPNDNIGSRIMFTSRYESVALLAKPSSPPLALPFLTIKESWDLFQQKVFGREAGAPELMELGKQITEKCQGLPLAIVVVAGILANEKKRQDRWKQVAETMNSLMASDPQLWEKTLALSYNHLPNHLKHCFLYFGVFPEDSQIRVRKLVWLWVAEGFVKKNGEQSLEDVAEGYLLDLIGRNLVLVSRRGYDGGVKACGMHDLLHDFCIKQAKKERSLQKMSGRFLSLFHSNHLYIMNSENAWTATSVFASDQNPDTFLCFNSQCTGSHSPGFLYPRLDLLRVLDVRGDSYNSNILELVHLRYLEFNSLSETYLPASISNLQNLETLILHGRWLDVTLPQCIRKMVKLRHIRLIGQNVLNIEGRDLDAQYPFSLDDLQTLSWVNPKSCEDFIAGTPNLRKLGLKGLIVNHGCLRFPDLSFLNYLQELKLHNIFTDNSGIRLEGIRFPPSRFPPILKKLTLKRTCLRWEEISTLGKLVPMLEVLKLLYDACRGPVWETSKGFPQLKFLKLESLDIMKWNASSSHFPKLQKLALSRCDQLEKIPSEMGDILTLQMIEVHCCNHSLNHSARKIKEEQESMGNNFLQVVISMQKVVLKLELLDDKSKQKAMKIISGFSGINSVALDMENKMTVIGDIDPVTVVTKLRKLCRADILTVGFGSANEPEKKDEPKKEEANKADEKNASRKITFCFGDFLRWLKC